VQVRVLVGLWRLTGLALLVVGLVLSPHAWHGLKAAVMIGEGALAQYRLSLIPPERYTAEITTALDQHDADLARSVLALAQDHGVVVPVEVQGRVAALPAVDLMSVAAQGWNCIVNGDFDSEAGLACVVATDLTSVGDIRDLVEQGGNYLGGRPVDNLMLGVSAVGLTLTAATVATGGGAMPLRVGASFLKAVRKAGKIPPRLAAELGGIVARSIDASALDEAITLARQMRLGELQRPLGRLLNPRAMAAVSDVAADLGTIHKVGGVRALKLSVEVADSTRDVKALAKTAQIYGDRFPAVLRVLGRGAVHAADLVWRLGGWLAAAVLWLLSMAWLMLRGVTGLARLLDRRVGRRLATQSHGGAFLRR
jgi:hypothetical protein